MTFLHKPISGARVALAVVVIALGAAWLGGSFDRPLSEVGLNTHACIVNAFGAKFCGQGAEDYCMRVDGLVSAIGQRNEVCDQILDR